MVPDDHRTSFLNARSTAFREADLVIVIGTRLNYVIGHRSAALLRQRQGDPDRHRSGRDRPDEPRRSSGIVGDAKAGAAGSCSPRLTASCDKRDFADWREQAGRRRGEQARRARGACPTTSRADPSAAAVQGGPRLHGPRRDPGRGRPGDPQLRPPVDPDLHARPPHQFRPLRHDGRRHAVRRRRQGARGRTSR